MEDLRTAKAVVFQKVENRPAITTQFKREDDSGHTEDVDKPALYLPQFSQDAEARPLITRGSRVLDSEGVSAPQAQNEDCQNLALRIVGWESKAVEEDVIKQKELSPPFLSSEEVPGETISSFSPSVEPLATQSLPYCPSPRLIDTIICAYSEERNRDQVLNGGGQEAILATPSISQTPKSANRDSISMSPSSGDENTIHFPTLKEILCQDPYALLSGSSGDQSPNEQSPDSLGCTQEQEKERQKGRKWQHQARGVEKRLKRKRLSWNFEKQKKDLPKWVRKLLKIKRQRYFDPIDIWRDNFNFGPSTLRSEKQEDASPLSPRSTCGSLADLGVNLCNNPSKRERHDSSRVEHPKDSHDDWPLIISSAQSNRSSQSIEPTQLNKARTAAEVHPGQLVDFTTPQASSHIASPNTPTLASDYDRNDFITRFETGLSISRRSTQDPIPTTSAVYRPSYCSANLKHHLQTVFSTQGPLTDSAAAAQNVLDEQIRIKGCELQRRPRTNRGHYPQVRPISMNRLRLRRKDSVGSTETVRPASPRRRSYVARCECTDAFLKFMHEVPEARMRRQLEREETDANTFDTPDKLYGEGHWLGDEPF